MKNLLPQPLLSLALFLTWLLLVNSTEPGHLVLSAVLALLIPHITIRFWPEKTSVRRPLVLIRFIGTVLIDIIVANIAVARLILGPVSALRPKFIHYPLQLRGDFAITALANTISLTPGTVSSDISPDRRFLLIHALDVSDEDALVAAIRVRYEQPLREIFE